MKHMPPDRIVALEAVPFAETAPLSREQRLKRWAEVLDAAPDRILRSLGEIEYRPHQERGAMRVEGSPLTVAYNDPVLRAEGLTSDRLGDATTFFNLTEHEAHRLLCSCHNGLTMRSSSVASRVRALADNRTMTPSLMLLGGLVAVLAGLPLVAAFL